VAFTTVKKNPGRQVAVIYLVTIFVGAVGAGLLGPVHANAFSMTMAMHAHEMKGLSPFLSCAEFFCSRCSAFTRGAIGWGQFETGRGCDGAEGKRIVLNVSNMTCEHCKETIIKTLSKNEAVKRWEWTQQKKSCGQLGKDLNERVLIESLDKVGFEAKLIEKNVP